MPCGSSVGTCLCRRGGNLNKEIWFIHYQIKVSCPITQIAITDLRAGEIAKAHIHEDMQEGFYVLSGELDIVLDGEIEHCKAEDFVWVKFGISHELKAITDVRVMTIGCEVN